MKGSTMKKILYTLAMALPLAMTAHLDDANAQRANHTKKDVPVAYEDAASSDAEKLKKESKHEKKMEKKHHKDNDGKHHKDHKDHKNNKEHKDHKGKKHHNEKMLEDKAEVEKNYDKAVKKINESSFDKEQKKLLLKQADENKELALRHIKERSELAGKHWDERQAKDGLKDKAMADKSNRKAIKKVRDIMD